VFRKLESVEEAKKALTQSFRPKPVGKEYVLLSNARNRILAVDVTSPLNVPSFDRSTVDGYAVKAADTFGADENRAITLKLIGQVNVGEAPKCKVENGTATLIVTGAPIPEGADSVVMSEYTVQENEQILVHNAVSKGENIMKAGSDIHQGEAILSKGRVLSSFEIGVVAALGFDRVEVFKRPKVAIISTGAEVVVPGKPLPPGKIYDINTYTLSAEVAKSGGEPLSLGIVQDQPDQMKASFRRALSGADVVLTSGGVSVGPTDIIPKMLNTLGKPGVIVYGIAIRPGKPTTIAVINGKPVFSLPGNPTSALLIFHLLVRPIIAEISGKIKGPPIIVKAVASERLFSAQGRRTFVTLALKRDRSGKIFASPVPTGLSGAITTLAKADGFTEMDEDQQFVEAGTTVTVQLFKPERYFELMKE
jgi:molybdenum cofactor synthesis domain-containing protein